MGNWFVLSLNPMIFLQAGNKMGFFLSPAVLLLLNFSCVAHFGALFAVVQLQKSLQLHKLRFNKSFIAILQMNVMRRNDDATGY